VIPKTSIWSALTQWEMMLPKHRLADETVNLNWETHASLLPNGSQERVLPRWTVPSPATESSRIAIPG
jgi:hypothetical protein